MQNNNDTNSVLDYSSRKIHKPSLFVAVFSDTRFKVVFVTLLIAASGLLLAVEKMKLYFRKQAVPIRIEFKTGISEQLGDWVQVMREDDLSEELLTALDTQEYLFCTYINARAPGKTPEQVRKEFSGKSPSENQKLVSQFRMARPEAVLSAAFTYYTGKADTVAHIPERCYLGEGFQEKLNFEETWRIGGDDSLEKKDAGLKTPMDLRVRYLTFEGEAGAMSLPYNVVYFFSVNGEYTCDSGRVRLRLQDLFNRYGYYSKVELMCASQDREKSAQAMREFLLSGIPCFEKSLPDWSEYRNR